MGSRRAIYRNRRGGREYKSGDSIGEYEGEQTAKSQVKFD
jgi:hypothetical protein